MRRLRPRTRSRERSTAKIGWLWFSMGIFRTFFGRKPATQPEVWAPPAPRAGLGLPPIEMPGRVEPGQATPGGYRRAYREDIDIPVPPADEDWTPDWSSGQGLDEALAEGEPAPVEIAAEAEPPEQSPAPLADIRTILAEVETLGDSPELGLLRQSLGAEPDGLFGFSTMYPAALIILLRNRFAGIGALGNLVTKPAWGHHYIVDTRYDVRWRSEIKIGEMDDAAVLAHESARLLQLRDELIVNLTENRRLFVYAGPATNDQIATIRAEMRGYGMNTLLHLAIADADHPPGHVVWREAGLLSGYLSRHGNKDGKWDIAKDDWVAVCRAAHQRWKPFART